MCKRQSCIKTVIVIILLAVIYSAGVFLRLEYRMFSENEYGRELPFTLESPLLFKYADMRASGYDIPDTDFSAQYPEGLDVQKDLSTYGDFIPALAYRFFKPDIPFQRFVRMFFPVFYCLGIFGIFTAARNLSGNSESGLLAAAVYAFSLMSVIRSSGVEFSRENFALPFICIHLGLVSAYINRPSALYALISAVALAAAQVFWDMTQLYLSIWVVIATAYLFFGKDTGKYKPIILFSVITVFYAGVSSPYLMSHGFLCSLPMLGLYLLGFLAVLNGKIKFLAKKQLLVIIWISLYIISSVVSLYGSDYGSVYSNFISLFFEKIRYANQIPSDPSQLTWDARILWTPALDSVGFRGVSGYFGITGFIFLLGFCRLIYNVFKNRFMNLLFLIPFVLICLMMFVLFRRMYVFLIIPVSVICGCLIACSDKKYMRRLLLAVFLIFAATEASRVYASRSHWVRDINYAAYEDILMWSEKATPEDSVILANFTICPGFNYYGRRNIVFHPKFENPVLRKKIFDYGEALFGEDETGFSGFCDRYSIDYYVFTRGTYSTEGPYSMRYIWGVREARPGCIASKFEKYGAAPFRFVPVYDNGIYRAYRYINSGEMKSVAEYTGEGMHFLGTGDEDSAESSFKKALNIYPLYKTAAFQLGRLYMRKGKTEEGLELIRNSKEMLFE
ncbi:MAG: hypothetical protein JW728_03475 [Candidatus Aureabacteria bacterium]|nr:hypothetical protein [Candidatus Auribacterota bacterium]